MELGRKIKLSSVKFCKGKFRSAARPGIYLPKPALLLRSLPQLPVPVLPQQFLPGQSVNLAGELPASDDEPAHVFSNELPPAADDAQQTESGAHRPRILNDFYINFISKILQDST